jgi:hypothetical protein
VIPKTLLAILLIGTGLLSHPTLAQVQRLYVSDLTVQGLSKFGSAETLDTLPHLLDVSLVPTPNTHVIISPGEPPLPVGLGMDVVMPPASPQGGNAIIGPRASGVTGSLGEVQIELADLRDENAQPISFVDGNQYEVVLWAKPSLYRETGDGEEWYLSPTGLTIPLIGGPLDGGSIGVSQWSPLSWTELRIPFTYNSATMTPASILGMAIPGSNLTQSGGSGGSFPLLLAAHQRSFQLDYGVPSRAITNTYSVPTLPIAALLALVCALISVTARQQREQSG